MPTEHNVITDPELHEPKGASTATAGEVYVSDGAGSGAWSNISGTNLVVVNSIADFPAAVAGVITLEANKVYIIAASISTSNRFVLAANNAFTSHNVHAPAFTYTGSGTMFTGTDVSSSFENINLSATSGILFSVTDSVGGVKACVMEKVAFNCATFGTFTDLSVLSMRNCGGTATQGMTLTGSNWNAVGVVRTSISSASATFIAMDIGSSVSPTWDIDNLVAIGPSGAIGVKGVLSSGNVPTGSIGRIRNCSFIGGMTTPLVNIDVDDIRWSIQANSPNVANTMPDGLLAMVGNSTTTSLTVGTPTLVSGTWTVERESHFTGTTAGRLTYNGERDLTTPIDIVLTASPDSGVGKTIRAYVAKNGTEVASSGKAIIADNGTPLTLAVPWQDTLVTTDYIEVFIENESDSTNVTVVDATLRIR